MKAFGHIESAGNFKIELQRFYVWYTEKYSLPFLSHSKLFWENFNVILTEDTSPDVVTFAKY